MGSAAAETAAVFAAVSAAMGSAAAETAAVLAVDLTAAGCARPRKVHPLGSRPEKLLGVGARHLHASGELGM